MLRSSTLSLDRAEMAIAAAAGHSLHAAGEDDIAAAGLSLEAPGRGPPEQAGDEGTSMINAHDERKQNFSS
jgi:hypothetical protein